MATALVFVSTLLAAACGGAVDDQTTSGADGSEAAAEPSGSGLSGEFTTIDGGSINLADFEGRDVVLWFWAPW